jgi:hypothetical protein
MTAPRWQNEHPPIVVHVTTLPTTFTLLSSMAQRRADDGAVYLEMRAPSGKVWIVGSENGLERGHLDDVYAAECILDQYGTWYLTWHGLDDPSATPREPTRVEVLPETV